MTEQLKRTIFRDSEHAASLEPWTVVRTVDGVEHTIRAKGESYARYVAYRVDTGGFVAAVHHDGLPVQPGADIAEVLSTPQDPETESVEELAKLQDAITADPLSCTGEPLPMVDADGSEEMWATVPAEVCGSDTDRLIWDQHSGLWDVWGADAYRWMPHLRPPKPGAPTRFDRPKPQVRPQTQPEAGHVWRKNNGGLFHIREVSGSRVYASGIDGDQWDVSRELDWFLEHFTYTGQRIEVRDGKVEVTEEGGE